MGASCSQPLINGFGVTSRGKDVKWGLSLKSRGKDFLRKDRLVFMLGVWAKAGGSVVQLVRVSDCTPPTLVRFPGATREFSPRVNFQCRLS